MAELFFILGQISTCCQDPSGHIQMQQGLIYLPSDCCCCCCCCQSHFLPKGKEQEWNFDSGKRGVGFLSKMVSKVQSSFIEIPLALSAEQPFLFSLLSNRRSSAACCAEVGLWPSHCQLVCMHSWTWPVSDLSWGACVAHKGVRSSLH